MTDRYVHPTTGVNTGAGSIGSPWLTLSYALGGTSALAAGDTIYCRGGTYAEQIRVLKSGTVGNRITVQAYNDEPVDLVGASGQTNIMVIPSGSSYITIGDGLRFSYGHSAPGGNYRFEWLQVLGNDSAETHHITLQNFTMERTPWSDLPTLAASVWNERGIFISNANDTLVTGVTIRGIRQGIQVREKSLRTTITYNDVGYTAQCPLTFGTSRDIVRGDFVAFNKFHHSAQEDGIQFQQDFDVTSEQQLLDDSDVGTIIFCNEIYENGENAIDLKGARSIIIDGNIFWLNRGSNDGYHPTLGVPYNSYATFIRGKNTFSRRVIFRNNIIFDSCGGGMLLQDYKYYNNTFVWNRANITGPNDDGNRSYGIFQAQRYLGGAARNNIFTGNYMDMQINSNVNQPTCEADLDYNLYGSGRWKNYATGTSYTSLSAWQAHLATNNWRYGKDANSKSVAGTSAVKFVDVPDNPTGVQGDYDFALQETSPAKGAGGWLTKTTAGGTATTTIPVIDATWFNPIDRTDMDYGQDRIFIAGQERTITALDDDAKTITVSSAVTFAINDPIYWVPPTLTATTTPDIGAMAFLTPSDPVTPPDPATAGGFWATTRVALNTTTGNQTIAMPSGVLTADPTLWKFTIIGATADNTATDGLELGQGWAWDNGGTIVQQCWGIRSRHNVNPAANTRRTSDTQIISAMLHSSSAEDVAATFVSGDRNNVVINISNAAASALHLIVTALAPDEAYIGTFLLSQTQDTTTTVTCGFEFDLCEVATVFRATPGSNSRDTISIGYASYNGTTLTQKAFVRTADQVAPSVPYAEAKTGVIGILLDQSGANNEDLQLVSPNSTSVGVKTLLGTFPESTNEGSIVLMRWAGLAVNVGLTTLPASTDSSYPITVGFETGFFTAVVTALDALAAVNSSGKAGAMGYGVWDGTREYSISISEEDNVSTQNTQSLSDSKFINMAQHDGTAGIVATALGPNGNDMELNVTTALSPASYLMWMAIEQPVVVTVTAVFSGTPLTGEHDLLVTFTDASSASGTTITGWAWDFGDSGTSTSQNPTHTYTVAGLYTVTLTVTDGVVSNTLARSEYVTVTDPPPPPVDPPPAETIGALFYAMAATETDIIPKGVPGAGAL